MDIRPIKPWDLPAFIKLRSKVEDGTQYMPARRGERKESIIYNLLKMLIYRRRHFNFVAAEEGELAGFVILVLGRYSKFRGNAYIANVSVDDKQRGRGLGKQLMVRAEEFARERGARRLELEVFARNKIAVELYRKLGYETEGVKRKAVESSDGYDDIIFMAKFLR